MGVIDAIRRHAFFGRLSLVLVGIAACLCIVGYAQADDSGASGASDSYLVQLDPLSNYFEAHGSGYAVAGAELSIGKNEKKAHEATVLSKFHLALDHDFEVKGKAEVSGYADGTAFGLTADDAFTIANGSGNPGRLAIYGSDGPANSLVFEIDTWGSKKKSDQPYGVLDQDYEHGNKGKHVDVISIDGERRFAKVSNVENDATRLLASLAKPVDFAVSFNAAENTLRFAYGSYEYTVRDARSYFGESKQVRFFMSASLNNADVNVAGKAKSSLRPASLTVYSAEIPPTPDHVRVDLNANGGAISGPNFYWVKKGEAFELPEKTSARKGGLPATKWTANADGTGAVLPQTISANTTFYAYYPDYVARTSNDGGGTWAYYESLEEAIKASAAKGRDVSVVELLKDASTADLYIDKPNTSFRSLSADDSYGNVAGRKTLTIQKGKLFNKKGSDGFLLRDMDIVLAGSGTGLRYGFDDSSLYFDGVNVKATVALNDQVISARNYGKFYLHDFTVQDVVLDNSNSTGRGEFLHSHNPEGNFYVSGNSNITGNKLRGAASGINMNGNTNLILNGDLTGPVEVDKYVAGQQFGLNPTNASGWWNFRSTVHDAPATSFDGKLYWGAYKYTFKLEGGNVGGDADDIVKTYVYGTGMNALDNPIGEGNGFVPKKAGYVFTGWATQGDTRLFNWTDPNSEAASGSHGGTLEVDVTDGSMKLAVEGLDTSAYTLGSKVAPQHAETTLYAQWAEKDPVVEGDPADPDYARVSFDGNGGSVAGGPVWVLKGRDLTRAEADARARASRPGHSLVGWNADRGAGSDGTPVRVEGDTTLYAQWAEKDPVVEGDPADPDYARVVTVSPKTGDEVMFAALASLLFLASCAGLACSIHASRRRREP